MKLSKIALVLAMLVAASAAHAQARRQKACTYWFGFCTSCEAPLTCQNSKLFPAENAGSSPPTGKAVSQPLTPGKAPLAGSSSTATAAKQPTSKQRKSSARKAPQKDFAKFKAFMRSQKIDGRALTDAEIAQMFARYQKWEGKR